MIAELKSYLPKKSKQFMEKALNVHGNVILVWYGSPLAPRKGRGWLPACCRPPSAAGERGQPATEVS